MDNFLKSKFKSGQKINESPFSLTYNGTTLSGEIPVIIKIYKRGTLNSSLIKVMKQKVKALQEFIDPRIVQLLDGDYGWQGFYYVRPYIKGQSLEETAKQQKLSVEAVEELAVQICEALESAHKKGIVHGAINPRNIIIDRNGINLVDFVIEGEVKESLPQKAESIISNCEYMSPEEIAGSSAQISSDIFAVGLLLYKLLSNNAAFGSQLDKLHGKIKPLTSAPRYLQDIIYKAMEPDPLTRFRTISQLGRSIKAKTILDPDNSKSFDLPQIELENKPKPQEEAVQIVKQERKKNFFVLILIAISVLSGLIYAVISSIIARQ